MLEAFVEIAAGVGTAHGQQRRRPPGRGLDSNQSGSRASGALPSDAPLLVRATAICTCMSCRGRRRHPRRRRRHRPPSRRRPPHRCGRPSPRVEIVGVGLERVDGAPGHVAPGFSAGHIANGVAEHSAVVDFALADPLTVTLNSLDSATSMLTGRGAPRLVPRALASRSCKPVPPPHAKHGCWPATMVADCGDVQKGRHSRGAAATTATARHHHHQHRAPPATTPPRCAAAGAARCRAAPPAPPRAASSQRREAREPPGAPSRSAAHRGGSACDFMLCSIGSCGAALAIG